MEGPGLGKGGKVSATVISGARVPVSFGDCPLAFSVLEFVLVIYFILFYLKKLRILFSNRRKPLGRSCQDSTEWPAASQAAAPLTCLLVGWKGWSFFRALICLFVGSEGRSLFRRLPRCLLKASTWKSFHGKRSWK